MIQVTRPYLPSRERLMHYIDGIYERHWLTNDGPLVQELTRRLEAYLGVDNLLLVGNGTLALQIAYRALGISGDDARGDAVTTPFSFAATASSLKWEGVQPVFADIDPATWCLDTDAVAAAITPATRAIVPVHVFGNACDVEGIDGLARRHGLRVVYDGAHAFGVTFRGESLLKWGDAATLSFHATKLFHTIEGGAIVFRRRDDLERARLMINFGIAGPEQIDELGINAKMNEFQAAMGLAQLDEIDINLAGRAAAWERYDQALSDCFITQSRHPACSNNYAYFPISLASESDLLGILALLQEHGVVARRYFYPSLSRVAALAPTRGLPSAADLSRAESLARRILCLPLYCGVPAEQVIEPLLAGWRYHVGAA
ncbi:DegT/DnrJ/EryC1/StrS family aminotransferase [Halomonas mongoliensis]|uniref:DegT/DnrJ/EryC1/StrS family aminotransferase n=1 Tax=Halomonas mongoliensis TaxID=321265 RepID=UPI00403AAE48